jgi:hypothetical protein
MQKLECSAATEKQKLLSGFSGISYEYDRYNIISARIPPDFVLLGSLPNIPKS